VEVETAIRKYLLAQSEVTGYVGQRVDKFRLTEPITGTGRRSIVVKRNGGWQTPDPVKTLEFPIVQIECWADPDRDADGNVSVSNALDKALAVQRVIDPLLHGQRGVRWSELMVVSSARWSETLMVTQDDTHGTLRLGDSVFVVTRYALAVVH
jgi:hypothetical protein